MSDFLSQEEINALLAANADINASSDEDSDGQDTSPTAESGDDGADQITAAKTGGIPIRPDILSAVEIDALGEVGNISMATAATTLSTLLSKSVDITTPTVSITTFEKLVDSFQTPFVALQIQFKGDLSGTNVLVIGVREAVIIAKLMMMQEVTSDFDADEIGEMELSAVSEAMNQMIGSASTAISTMLNKFIDIAPPITAVGKGGEVDLSLLNKEEEIVQIVFRMTIEDLVDSEIMQVYSLESAKLIVKYMMGGFDTPEAPAEEPTPVPEAAPVFEQPPQQPMFEQAPQMAPQQPMFEQAPQMQPQQPVFEQQPQMMPQQPVYQQPMYGQPAYGQPMGQPMYDPQYMVAQKPQFAPLAKPQRPNQPKNIELILDVPMEMSVILGRTQRSVKQILSLGPGSVIELNKYAEEPLDIFVNGMLVGQGEVVVIEEKFGIRVNSIVSTKERAESLGSSK